MTERRRARRYILLLPVTIEAFIENKTSSRTGKTLDISTHGVYLVLDNDLEVGMKLGLTIRLLNRSNDGTPVFIRAIGKVVRVEKGLEYGVENVGVAAAIRRYECVCNQMTDNSSHWLSSLVRTFAR